jgi:hypothetical protein
VAGWYNLFLGGSIFAMWEVLGTKFLRKLAKVWGKLSQWLSSRWKIIYLLLSSGIVIYIFIDCINSLILNPVGSTTLLTSSIAQGLCLSVCLPQYTSVPSQNIVGGYIDKANSTAFWVYGNNLSNKIRDLSVITQSGDVLPVWNMSQSTTSSQAMHLFSISNIVSSDFAVDFCHTVELSALSLHMSGLRVRAVNDIELVIHLAGQLLASRTKYGVANTETAKGPFQGNLVLYNSIVRLQFEETSFQNVSSHTCKNYNTTWTYDSCVMNYVTSKLEGNKTLLLSLLLPSINTTVQHGIERVILQSLYAALLSENVETVCLPDCRSLIVTMRPEASPVKAQPTSGILVSRNNSYVPLPPLLMEVNITVPDLSKLNQVIIYNINIFLL